MVYIQLIWITVSRNISVNSEKINFRSNNTKYDFVAHDEIIIDFSKLHGG